MNNRFTRLSVNLLHRDKAALRRLAKLAGESMAVTIRRLIRDAAQESNPGQTDRSDTQGHPRMTND